MPEAIPLPAPITVPDVPSVPARPGFTVDSMGLPFVQISRGNIAADHGTAINFSIQPYDSKTGKLGPVIRCGVGDIEAFVMLNGEKYPELVELFDVIRVKLMEACKLVAVIRGDLKT